MYDPQNEKKIPPSRNLFIKTEMEGFEPSRREYRPAAFRVRSLRPLGYISTGTILL